MFRFNNDYKNNRILALSKNKLDKKIKLINKMYNNKYDENDTDVDDLLVYKLYNLNNEKDLLKSLKLNHEPLINS
tara:strand:+ start:875 stop:1099 length:225 start_codon:yes stop_codon:yes gene_type:complete